MIIKISGQVALTLQLVIFDAAILLGQAVEIQRRLGGFIYLRRRLSAFGKGAAYEFDISSNDGCSLTCKSDVALDIRQGGDDVSLRIGPLGA